MLFLSFCPFCGAKIQISFHIMSFTLDKIVNILNLLIYKELSIFLINRFFTETLLRHTTFKKMIYLCNRNQKTVVLMV